jgi:carboxymethylenebutenolidase
MTVDQRIIDEYDRFAHGDISRRELLDRLATLAGGAAAGLALLPLIEGDAMAQIVPENDSRLATERIKYDAAGTQWTAYLARLKPTQKRPAVLVISEIWGLNAHIEDVARRFAIEGFLALAPDVLSPTGGTPPDSQQAFKLIGALNPQETVTRLAATVALLAKHAESTGKVGVVGFCWGGGMVNQVAVAAGASLNAAVAYYGPQVPAGDVPRISAPLLLHYGSLDTRINGGIADYETALKANKKTCEIFMYDGAAHAFNNDTNEKSYNKAAATLAWGRTIAFFKKYLV